MHVSREPRLVPSDQIPPLRVERYLERIATLGYGRQCRACFGNPRDEIRVLIRKAQQIACTPRIANLKLDILHSRASSPITA